MSRYTMRRLSKPKGRPSRRRDRERAGEKFAQKYGDNTLPYNVPPCRVFRGGKLVELIVVDAKSGARRRRRAR